ncbi:CHAT domain-containing protein [uncultured Alteromonas sp.]|jgi:tetratricopeptide (TPR) repeat protein|uniref:CHAT domain-containing protein n=1 Tax=uncultured Alteromonas sp. TaxID=179113 RepID=UPI0025D566A9|nr:CHAT domain-containing protein [uncultured Alteromonas sp.]
MEPIRQSLSLGLILFCLALFAGQRAVADEFQFTVTAAANEVIIVEAPDTAFNITLDGTTGSPANSHYGYTHIAAIRPQSSAEYAVTITVNDNSEPSVTASEFAVYSQPANALWDWLAWFSATYEDSGNATVLTEQIARQSDAETACFATALLARQYLIEENTEQASSLLAPAANGYTCWQLAALAMSANFGIYHFADASNAGMALLPGQFKNALTHATSVINPADWQPASESLPGEPAGHMLPANSYLTTQLIATLGFSNLLHGSVVSSQTLMEAGKYSLEQARSQAIEQGYTKLLPDIYNGLATYWSLANDNVAAARYLNEAIRSKQQSGDTQGLAEITNNLALVYLWSGRWELAQQTFREATEYLTEDDADITAAVLTANLASSYSYLGDTDTAERYYQRTLTLNQSRVYDDDSSHLYIALAKIAMAGQRWPAALDALTQAEQKAENLRSDRLPLIYALQAQALVHNMQPAQANKLKNTALDTLDNVVKMTERIQALTALTDTRIQLGEYPEAAKQIEQLLALIDDDDPQQVALASLQYQLLKATEPQNKSALAATFSKANQHILQLGRKLDAYQMGPHWFNKVRELYDAHLDTLLSHPTTANTEQALALLETYQSQLFLRKRQDRQHQHLLKQPELESLWQQRLTLEGGLVNAIAENDKQHLQQQLDNVKEQWLRLVNPSLSSEAITTEKPLTLASVQTAIKANQVVLRYLHASEQCYVLAISASRHQVTPVKCPPALPDGLSGAEIIQAYRDARASDFIPQWVTNNPNITDIMWQADGRFFALPMAQLRLHDNQYVGGRYTLRQTPSLSEYLSPTLRQAAAPMAIGIFDSPAFESKSPTADTGWRNKLPALPWAKREGDQLASLFSNYAVERYSAEQATQQALLSSDLREAPLLHIATHSYFDPEDPAIVGLAVARNPSTTTPDNGFLSQSALLGEPFNNQLVVLSGCETSLGKMMAHDGLQSLAYGVLTAGADSVISTRWKVSDKPTATFMQYFYQGLKQSGSSTQALRHARQQMQRHPRFKHPMHWAGFTLTVVNQNAEFFLLQSPQ